MTQAQVDRDYATRSKVASAALAQPTSPAADATLSDHARLIAASLSDQSISVSLLTGAVRLFEFLAVALVGLAIYLAYVLPVEGIALRYGIPIIGGAAVAVLLIQTADGYTIPVMRSLTAQFVRVLVSWTLLFAFFAVAAFLTKSGAFFSRGFFLAWFAIGLAVLMTFRFGLTALIRRWTKLGRLERRAVIVGGGANAEELIRALEAQADNDIRICGIFDDRGDARSPAIVAGYPKLGTIAELVAFGRLARIDMLIVTLPLTAENRLLQFLQQLWVLPVDIRLSAHSARLRFRPRSYSFVGTVPFLDVFDKPIADWDGVLKRAFDIVFASFLIVLFSPVMLATAIAIKLDSRGPVFFKQHRHGFNNELIKVFKFRSMHQEATDHDAKVAVTKNDPRVTRVGRFIRKTSIDELPQFFNVIRGDLSLVGPRPHAPTANTGTQLYNEVVDGYFARHRVKPGVTGWAQINGWRGEVDTPEKIRNRVAHDLYYIENWSVLFDLRIIALTPIRLFTTENAY
ncbi:MAG: undecaprenyl-phosphate glucose phosphotransferase [Bauldia sp.]|nr:undecaprenyl-phosphate glucose phosphotransferase [Bauldia sp.]